MKNPLKKEKKEEAKKEALCPLCEGTGRDKPDQTCPVCEGTGKAK